MVGEIRWLMPRDRWTWCYVHEVAGEFTAALATIKNESQQYG